MPSPSAPETIDAFHQRLTEIAGGLPKRLRQCADHLSAHPERIALSTVADLARGAGVQPSAMIRFCQIMGFSGFSELQRLFRESYGDVWPDYTTRLQNLSANGAESPAAILAEFIDASRTSLENMAKTADQARLDAAVAVLGAARTVHVIGLRRAFAVAVYLDYVFDKMEVPCLLHDGLGKLDRRHALRQGDALLAVSFAPYSPETLDLADHARAMGLPVVALTDTAPNPLIRPGDTVLTVTEVDFGAFRVLSATLALALALAVAVGARRGAPES